MCVENHLYTDSRNKGNGADRLESDLAENIEAQTSDLVRRILKMVRGEERKLELSLEDRKTWAKFTWIQYNRHPDVRDKLRDRGGNPDMLREIERDMGRPASPQECQEFYSPEKNKEVADATFRGTVIENRFHELYWPNMKNKSIGAILMEDGAGEFVIGSQPLIVDPPDSGIVYPGVKLLYPISYDVIVGYDLPDGRVQVFTSYDQARRWNELSLSKSEMIMGRSRELVSSLADRDLQKK